MNPSLSPGTERKVRVLIADDHHIVRVGLRAILNIHPQLEVVGEASDGGETLDLAARHSPDVVLLDLRMPSPDGLAVCSQLKTRMPDLAILFLTSYADDQTILAAIEAGADGYLLKSFSGQNIAAAILTVANGGSVLDPMITRRVLASVSPKPATAGKQAANPFESLTSQETRVLELVASGRSNKQIAVDLRLSEGTVRNYLSAVFAKLKVESRVQAASLWLRRRP